MTQHKKTALIMRGTALSVLFSYSLASIEKYHLQIIR